VKNYNHLRGPDVALIAITRVILGVGIGLLLARRLSEARSAAAGWALFLVGVVTTVPLAVEVLGCCDERPNPSAITGPRDRTSPNP